MPWEKAKEGRVPICAALFSYSQRVYSLTMEGNVEAKLKKA
jgi:hypothetical protein